MCLTEIFTTYLRYSSSPQNLLEVLRGNLRGNKSCSFDSPVNFTKNHKIHFQYNNHVKYPVLNKRLDLNGHTVRFFRVTSWPNTLFWNVFLVQKFHLRNKGQIYAKSRLFLLRLLMCPRGHFWVAPSLCFEARLSAKPMIWKWIFILMQIKLLIRKFLHFALFWM